MHLEDFFPLAFFFTFESKRKRFIYCIEENGFIAKGLQNPLSWWMKLFVQEISLLLQFFIKERRQIQWNISNSLQFMNGNACFLSIRLASNETQNIIFRLSGAFVCFCPWPDSFLIMYISCIPFNLSMTLFLFLKFLTIWSDPSIRSMTNRGVTKLYTRYILETLSYKMTRCLVHLLYWPFCPWNWFQTNTTGHSVSEIGFRKVGFIYTYFTHTNQKQLVVRKKYFVVGS